MKLSLNATAVIPHLLAMVVLYLASGYLGGMFRLLFGVMVMLPTLSLLHAAVVAFSLRIDQHLEDAAPSRGDRIPFSAWVENSSWLPAPHLCARLILAWPGAAKPQADLQFSLLSQSEYHYQATIACSHRGSYRVGLDWVRFSDMLGLCTVCRPVQQQSFYVYPRVITVRSAGGPAVGAGASASATVGREVDPTLLRGVSEYQRDQPMQHIAWRLFAAYGIPYVKEYDSGQRTATVIYIDLRAIQAVPERRLEVDDCSIEILVAVVKALAEAEIPVEVHGIGTQHYQARLSAQVHFREFLLSTRLIEFGREYSPRLLMASYGRRRSDRPQAALLITHRLDNEIVELLRGSGTEAVPAIVNLMALSDEQRAVARRLAHQSHIDGGSVRLIEDSTQIGEALALC